MAGSSGTRADWSRLLERCSFPAPGTAVDCAVSGGADSLALLVLAAAAGLDVTAWHVDHGLRFGSDREADVVVEAAARQGTAVRTVSVAVEPGPNLEARARAARQAVLPSGTLTGHTADDQAETVLVALLRGAGLDGLAAMRPDSRHPILALRRSDTVAVCEAEHLRVVVDPTNFETAFVRNRVRHELLPLASQIAGRDIVPLLARTASVLRDEAETLNDLAQPIDPTDVAALRAAPAGLARRALRQWLATASGGYPPDAGASQRVMEVVAGRRRACEVAGLGRVSRQGGRLYLRPGGSARTAH